MSAAALLRSDHDLDAAFIAGKLAPTTLDALLRCPQHQQQHCNGHTAAGDKPLPPSLSGLVRGGQSLGALLGQRGWPCTPSSDSPMPVSAAALGQTLKDALRFTAPVPALSSHSSHTEAGGGTCEWQQLVPLLLEHGAAIDETAARTMALELWPFVAATASSSGSCGDENDSGDGPLTLSRAGIYFGGAYTVQHYTSLAGSDATIDSAEGASAALGHVVAIQIEVAPAGRESPEGRASFSQALVGAILEWLQYHYGWRPPSCKFPPASGST